MREKEFIEATSRITSFNVMSRPDIPISPIEIRLTKDRLSLVSRVLSSNGDAYKYTEVILDLVRKLGFQDDQVAEVKALAMIADTALQVEDFDCAYENNELMIKTVLQLRADDVAGEVAQDAAEVCWVACFQLGRQPEFADVRKKLVLLGRALEFCPPERIADVLSAWHHLEAEDIEHRKESLKTKQGVAPKDDTSTRRNNARNKTPPSVAMRFNNLRIPSIPSSPDATGLANTFSRVAANFPFSVGGRKQLDDNATESREGVQSSLGHGDVSTQASRAFQKGIGWLIGVEDE